MFPALKKAEKKKNSFYLKFIPRKKIKWLCATFVFCHLSLHFDIRMPACLLSCFSHVQLFAILWTVACQVPLSMGFSRQEYWSELPWPPPRDLPNPRIKFPSPMWQADFFFYHWATREAFDRTQQSNQNSEGCTTYLHHLITSILLGASSPQKYHTIQMILYKIIRSHT